MLLQPAGGPDNAPVGQAVDQEKEEAQEDTDEAPGDKLSVKL